MYNKIVLSNKIFQLVERRFLMEINTSQILKGTLEACILQLIKNKDMYGYEITEQLSKYGLDIVAQGTIYPLLMKKKVTLGLLESIIRLLSKVINIYLVLKTYGKI